MDNDPISLDAIGCRFRTDKASIGHDYLSFYERYFCGLRDDKLTLLEIGVLNGASLKVWEAYFPNAAVIGADINPACRRFAGDRVSIETMDQGNIEDLVQLGIRHGPFDVIIEDGSHRWDHQITTLRTLFPFLRNGGYYVVEDLQTNYGAMADQYRGSASTSCVEFLKGLVDLRVADRELDISGVADPFLRTYGRSVAFITFYRRCCLLQKDHRGWTSVIDEPLVGVEAGVGRVAVPVIVHIGQVGDYPSANGSIRSDRFGRNIQGFAVEGAGGPADFISYRGRLADGSWTDWVHCGQYAGTRGLAQDLTGFSVRLTKRARERYALSTAGLFREDGEVVVAGDGGDCVSRSATAALYGMQIVLCEF